MTADQDSLSLNALWSNVPSVNKIVYIWLEIIFCYGWVHYQGYKYLTNEILKCQRNMTEFVKRYFVCLCAVVRFSSLVQSGELRFKHTVSVNKLIWKSKFKIKAELQFIWNVASRFVYSQSSLLPLLPMQVNGAFHGIEKTRVIRPIIFLFMA